jgi:glutamyl-tRNA reductase
LSEFKYWLEHVLHEPIYNGHGNEIDTIRQEELSEILNRLSPDLRDELDQATLRLVDRVIQVTSRTAADKSK